MNGLRWHTHDSCVNETLSTWTSSGRDDGDVHVHVCVCVHVPSSVARELMSRHFGLHKARLLEATVTDIYTGKKQEGRRAMLTMATAPFRLSFPPAWGDSLRTLTDIQRETVFVSVEKVTRMRGS